MTQQKTRQKKGGKEKKTNKKINVQKLLNSGRLIKTKDIPKTVKALKDAGLKIVLTQGVWDLIHIGHARYMQKAKKLGDVLIVAVDTDEVVKFRKGPNRPIVPQSERVKMVSHLRSVDLIVLKESKTDNGKLIRMIKPEIFVVSQTTKSTKPGKDFIARVKKKFSKYCGDIIGLKPQATTSTTARIRLLTIKGAKELANELHKVIDKFLKN